MLHLKFPTLGGKSEEKLADSNSFVMIAMQEVLTAHQHLSHKSRFIYPFQCLHAQTTPQSTETQLQTSMQKILPFACSCSVGLVGTRALDPKARGEGITRPEETLQTKKREHGKEDNMSLENVFTSPQT